MSTARDLYGACSEIEVALDCLFREQGHRAAYADNALAKIRVAVGDGVFQFRSEPPTRWKCTKCGEQYDTEKGNPPAFPEPAPAEQGEESIHAEAQESEGDREARDAAWLKCRAEREPIEGSDDWTVGEVGIYRGFFNLAARLAQSPTQSAEGLREAVEAWKKIAKRYTP